MSSEIYTSISHQSWGSRLGASFKGILTGFVLVAGGLYVLGWNEGNSVGARRSLQEAEHICVHLPSIDTVDPTKEGALIHISGLLTPGTVLTDVAFHVQPPQPALKLKRTVEMYQWTQSSTTKDEKKHTGGSSETETTYTYHKEWVDHVVHTDSFYVTDHHENPSHMRFANQVLVSNVAHMGAFDVPTLVLGHVNYYRPLTPANYSTAWLPEETVGDHRGAVSVYPQQGYYFGDDQKSPQIGDTRVTFTYVPQQVRKGSSRGW